MPEVSVKGRGLHSSQFTHVQPLVYSSGVDIGCNVEFFPELNFTKSELPKAIKSNTLDTGNELKTNCVQIANRWLTMSSLKALIKPLEQSIPDFSCIQYGFLSMLG